jgi:tRNA G10  N-methylase Trm11
MFIFIPGKNWRLSLAELGAYFAVRAYSIKVVEASAAFFVLKGSATLERAVIDDLGGIIKIGRVTAVLPTSIVRAAFINDEHEALEKVRAAVLSNSTVSEITSPRSGKPLFGISVYSADSSLHLAARKIHRFIGSALKSALGNVGKHFHFIGYPPNRSMPQLTAIEVLKKNLVNNNAEILFCIGKRNCYAAITIAVHDPLEFQKRDVHKPVQRRIFAMPPRIARIMINLAGCMTNKTLLDPFCGVGTVLQEALLAGAYTIGGDINPWCVEASKRNLSWLKAEYSQVNVNYDIAHFDACHLCFKDLDSIATEPDLGPALSQVPTVSYAERLVKKLKPLFTAFTLEAYNALRKQGRLVMVTPYFRTRTRDFVGLSIDEDAYTVGFKKVNSIREEMFEDHVLYASMFPTSPLTDFEARHKVGREIHIFEK